MTLDTRGQRQRVYSVHGTRPPHYRPAAQLLQRQHFVHPPDPLHPVPVQRHPRQLTEGLADVKVAQRRDLEAGHLMAHRVHLCRLGGHLSLELQMQTIAHEHFRYARCMFLDFFEPPIDAVETPFVGNVVD